MTTASDIKKAGGKCTKIATDFWECTDKDGVVWWCSDQGKVCTMKPKRESSASDCSSDRGDMMEEHVAAELEKRGRSTLLQEISAAARRSLATSETGGKARPKGLAAELLSRVDQLLIDGLKATEWDNARLVQAIRESEWAKLSLELAVTAIARDNDTTGEQTPSTKCRNQYDRCMEQNDCEYSFFCLCCQPCVWEYLGCMKDIVFRESIRGGILDSTLATTQRA